MEVSKLTCVIAADLDVLRPLAKLVIDKATETARGIAEQAKDVADRAQRAPGAMKEAVDSSLKQQPMITLAAAGAWVSCSGRFGNRRACRRELEPSTKFIARQRTT